MTPDEIDALPEGEQLDTAIATHIFGFFKEANVCEYWPEERWWGRHPEGHHVHACCTLPLFLEGGDVHPRDGLPRFSERLVAAFALVEEMKGCGYSFAMWDVMPTSSVQRGPIAAFRKSVYPPNRAENSDTKNFYGLGATVPEAICRAALKAVLAERTRG